MEHELEKVKEAIFVLENLRGCGRSQIRTYLVQNRIFTSDKALQDALQYGVSVNAIRRNGHYRYSLVFDLQEDENSVSDAYQTSEPLGHDDQLSTTYASTGTFRRSQLLGTGDIRTVPAPSFAESVTEGDIKWEKAVGDRVEVDELLAEIETDKTIMPVHAPAAGIIEDILVKDGETVKAGKPLFKLRLGGASQKSDRQTEDGKKMDNRNPSTIVPITSEQKPQPDQRVVGSFMMHNSWWSQTMSFTVGSGTGTEQMTMPRGPFSNHVESLFGRRHQSFGKEENQ